MKVTPEWKPFARACRPGALIPLAVEVPLDTETPVSAYLKLARGESSAFLFESVEGGERVGRWSFLGVRPRRVFRWRQGDSADALSPLRESLAQPPPVRFPGMPRFVAGWVGFLAYDAVRQFEPRVPMSGAREHDFPDSLWMDFDTVVAFDHVRHTVVVVTELECHAGVSARSLYAEGMARVERIFRRLEQPLVDPPRPPVTRPAKLVPRVSRARFERAVRRAREYIHAGDCQQIVLSQRFEAEVEAEPLELYRALRRINPSPYLFLVQHEAQALIGSSPETLIQLDEGEVVLRPIAGTRRRGQTPEEDDALERELLADEKENAEHVMLVDLGRNDVGRVSEVGSVCVERLKKVERYSHVMHLVSQVRGRLAPGLNALDVLRAGFPAGTVSGSPKVRAMQIIDELEPALRGPYAGAVGWLDRHGNMETAIAIRTFTQSGRKLAVQAGAGIVFDSDPAAEYQETVNKARALFKAVEEAQKGREGFRLMREGEGPMRRGA